MRPLLFDPSVELLMGHGPCEWCAAIGVGTPREPFLWGLLHGASFGPRSMWSVPIWVERVRFLSLGLPVELPVGHDPLEG